MHACGEAVVDGVRTRGRASGDGGWTLIEILVVILIIAVLAGIAIPMLLEQRERAWQAQLISDVRNVAVEIEALGTSAGGDYPTDWASATAGADGVDVSGFTAVNWAYADNGTSFCVAAQHPMLAHGVAFYDTSAGGLQPFLSGDSDAQDNC